jgi:hypothetical protein
MSKVNLAVDETKRDLRAAVVQALADLDTIIANADTLTTVQVRAAIKKLAQHQRVIIKRLVKLS